MSDYTWDDPTNAESLEIIADLAAEPGWVIRNSNGGPIAYVMQRSDLDCIMEAFDTTGCARSHCDDGECYSACERSHCDDGDCDVPTDVTALRLKLRDALEMIRYLATFKPDAEADRFVTEASALL